MASHNQTNPHYFQKTPNWELKKNAIQHKYENLKDTDQILVKIDRCRHYHLKPVVILSYGAQNALLPPADSSIDLIKNIKKTPASLQQHSLIL